MSAKRSFNHRTSHLSERRGRRRNDRGTRHSRGRRSRASRNRFRSSLSARAFRGVG